MLLWTFHCHPPATMEQFTSAMLQDQLQPFNSAMNGTWQKYSRVGGLNCIHLIMVSQTPSSLRQSFPPFWLVIPQNEAIFTCDPSSQVVYSVVNCLPKRDFPFSVCFTWRISRVQKRSIDLLFHEKKTWVSEKKTDIIVCSKITFFLVLNLFNCHVTLQIYFCAPWIVLISRVGTIARVTFIHLLCENVDPPISSMCSVHSSLGL